MSGHPETLDTWTRHMTRLQQRLALLQYRESRELAGMRNLFAATGSRNSRPEAPMLGTTAGIAANSYRLRLPAWPGRIARGNGGSRVETTGVLAATSPQAPHVSHPSADQRNQDQAARVIPEVRPVHLFSTVQKIFRVFLSGCIGKSLAKSFR